MLVVYLGLIVPAGQSVFAEDEQAASSEEIEEVTVFGRRSLSSMRMELVDAQENLYEMFNVAIADPKFNIRCRRYTPTGTRLSQRVCEGAYAQDAMTESAQMAFATGSISSEGALSVGVGTDPVPRILNGNRELVDKMVIAVNENPELRQAVLEFERMQQQFLEALNERGESKN